MEKDTIESRVASAILERPDQYLIIDGKEYKFGSPSLATLILVSEIVATLPIVEDTEDLEKRTYSVLHYAKDFKPLADMAAILILGAKNLTEQRTITTTKKYCFGLFKRTISKTETIDKKSELAKEILLNVSPSELFNTVMKRLRENEAGVFFVITTSLSEANLLKPTREVENL